MICRELGYIKNAEEVLDLMNKLFAMLSALITSVRKKVNK